MTTEGKGTLSLEFTNALIIQRALVCPWWLEEKGVILSRTNSLLTFVRAALDGQQLSLTTFHQHCDTCHINEGASVRSQCSQLRDPSCFLA